MYNNFLKIVILGIGANALASCYSALPPSFQIKGCIKTQGTSTGAVPQLRVLYEGKETISNPEGFFSFSAEEDFNECALIMCKSIKQNFDKINTLKYESISKRYRYFAYTRGCDGIWQQQEKKLNQKSLILPKHAIVVLIDPTYVERVEPWHLNALNNVFKLPAIVLKEINLKKKPLPREAAKSLIYSLDNTVFHEPVEEVVKITGQPKIISSCIQ